METIKLVNDETSQDRKDFADQLREYADKIEAGEVVNAIFIANNRTMQAFIATSCFRNRWELLGALEFAKSKVHES